LIRNPLEKLTENLAIKFASFSAVLKNSVSPLLTYP
jgi:hypothetical protein